MPTFRYLRQWGAISPEYMDSVEVKIVQAVRMAKGHLTPSVLYLGKSRAPGASHNRTTNSWKPDEQFNEDSTDADRWVDALCAGLVRRLVETGREPDAHVRPAQCHAARRCGAGISPFGTLQLLWAGDSSGFTPGGHAGGGLN